MASNVVFPEHFAKPSLRVGDQPREEGPEKRNQRDRMRLREIETAAGKSGVGKKGHVFGRVSDRITAAQAVGALVRQAKEMNVAVESIKLALPGTARLDRYKLSPDIKPDAAKSGKLQQRVLGYLEVAAAIAKLTRQDPDALKIQVLRETSLWSRPSAARTEDDPRASCLAVELVEMGAAVAKRGGLEGLFARARRIPGVWDIAHESFNRSAIRRADLDIDLESSMACLHRDFYLDLFEHWTEAPPLPSIPLVRCVHAVFYAPTVRIEAVGREEPLNDDAVTDDFEGDDRVAVFELSREIRLALGPTTSADNIGAMFESRAHLSLGLFEPSLTLHELVPSHTLKPIDNLWDAIPPATFQVFIDGFWHRVAMTESPSEMEGRIFAGGEHPMAWRVDPMDPESASTEHWYLSWSAINSASVAHWLDRKSGVNDTKVVTPSEGERSFRPVWYTSDSTARQVEHALASGGLEEALEGVVQRFREALDERETRWRAEAQIEHEARMIQWQQEI